MKRIAWKVLDRLSAGEKDALVALKPFSEMELPKLVSYVNKKYLQYVLV